MPFRFSSTLNEYSNDFSSSVVGGSAGLFGLVNIVFFLLMSNLCTNVYVLTRHGGVDEVVSLEFSDSLPCFKTVVGHVG